MNITYKMYTGKYLSSYIVDDGVFIASYRIGTNENDNSIKNLEINFYDANGDYKWTATYDKEYNSLKPASGIVSSIVKVDNMYYIMLNVTYENDQEIEHLLKYNLNGKLVKDVVIKKGDNPYDLAYLGKYKDKYYYNNEAMIFSVAAITKENYKLLFEDSEEEAYPDQVVMNDKYLYGIESIYQEHEAGDESDYDYTDVIGTYVYKFDLNGNLLKSIEVKDNYNGAEKVIVTNNYLFLVYYSELDNEFYVSEYNHDLELINKSIDYKKDLNYEIYNISGNDDKLYFEYTYNDDYIINVTDEKLETINTYKSISEDALEQRYFIDNLGYIGNNFVQVFLDLDAYDKEEEILMAFYSKK